MAGEEFSIEFEVTDEINRFGKLNNCSIQIESTLNSDDSNLNIQQLYSSLLEISPSRFINILANQNGFYTLAIEFRFSRVVPVFPTADLNLIV
jgi:hypothetical protein